MILIKFSGGLGNQMFQYALYIVLKEKFPDEEIYADLSRYGIAHEHEGFDLNKYFNVALEIASKKETKNVAPFSDFLKKFTLGKNFFDKYIGWIERIDWILGGGAEKWIWYCTRLFFY